MSIMQHFSIAKSSIIERVAYYSYNAKASEFTSLSILHFMYFHNNFKHRLNGGIINAQLSFPIRNLYTFCFQIENHPHK